MADRKRKPGKHGDSVRRRKVGERRRRAGEKPEGGPPPPLEGDVRLNRYIAQAGLCSRRTADEWIAAGRVSVNGETVTEVGTKVTAPTDRVEVDGRPIHPQSFAYVLLNKPRDTITTTDDPQERRTVMDLLDADLRQRGVVPVGRLDRDTTGVLLLTNDGDLAHRLMHPRYGVSKIYRVETERSVTQAELERLASGVDLDDGVAKADQVTHLDEPNRLALSLHEGRNRQVRRMIEAIGHRVRKLDRSDYGGLDTGGLARGRWRLLEPHEVNRLRRSVKLKPLVF